MSDKTHELIVTETDAPKYQNQVESLDHRWLVDEPKEMGGGDTGPDPYDMLLGALGACTSMTLRMYADRKGWPLEKVRVGLAHRRIHKRDCDDCPDSDAAFVDAIEREVEIFGDELNPEQRARLLEIADKCPVHRTLTKNYVKVRTREA